ncbi:MAG TPA: flippase [Candidatus Polarisedimenticolaceae bacterium]|nr:flippase [Candidatus Polarisedimenticolaceae bacterium]
MSTVRTTLKNMAALATGQAAYRLGLVALEILLARSIAPSQFGDFAAALGFAGIFLVVMDMGVALGLVRSVSRRDPGAATYFGNSLALRGWMALGVFPVMVGLAAWLQPASRVPLVALLGLFVIASSFQEVLASVHQGLKEMEWIAGFRLAIVAATAAGVLFALAMRSSLPLVVAAYPVAGIAGFALWYAVTSRRLRPRVDRATMGMVLRDTLLYGGMYVASVLTFRQGVVVLSFFRSGVDIADFAAGYRLLEVSSKIPLVISMALVPEMFRSARENPARLELLFRMQLRVLGLLVLPVAVAIALFAPEIIRLIYGPGYAGAVPVLRVFACMLPLSFMDGALGDSLTARDLQGRRTRIYVIVLVIGLVANVLLAWIWGPVGSAAALLVSEMALFTLLTVTLGTVTSLKPLRRVGRGALAALAAGAACWLLRDRVSSLALGPAFLVLYVVLCFAFQAVHREELSRLVRRLRTG